METIYDINNDYVRYAFREWNNESLVDVPVIQENSESESESEAEENDSEFDDFLVDDVISEDDDYEDDEYNNE